MKYVVRIAMAFFFVVVVMSCQKEIDEITEPTNETSLKVASKIASLIQKTAMKDGSTDNIIDGASCLEVQLPVSVIVNGLKITIVDAAGFETIEAVFDKVDFDEDVLEIIFPITIITSNYDEFVINNTDELEKYTDKCGEENALDDDIECLDFVYPIAISVYDSARQLLNTVSIEDDKRFYQFIENMEAYHVATINFPIRVVLHDGTEVVVKNMLALGLIIEASDGQCDEDDDFDYDDDDCEDCTQEELLEMLFACPLKIDKLKVNNQDFAESYTGVVLNFFENGKLTIVGNGEEHIAAWKIDTTDAGIFLTMIVPELPKFNVTWRLYEMEDDGRFDFRQGENRLKLRKKCIVSKAKLIEELKEGDWMVAKHRVGNADQTEMYQGYEFNFNSDGTLSATNDTGTIKGDWEVYEDSNTLGLQLSFGTQKPVNILNNNWSFVTMIDGRIALEIVANSVVNAAELILEKQ